MGRVIPLGIVPVDDSPLIDEWNDELDDLDDYPADTDKLVTDEFEDITEQDGLIGFDDPSNDYPSDDDEPVTNEGWVASLVDSIDTVLYESGLSEDTSIDERLLLRLTEIANDPWKKMRTNVYLSQKQKINPSEFWHAVEVWEEQLMPKPEILPIEVRLANPKQLAWLVDNLILTPGFSIIAGAPKSGKSCWIRWLLYCIATGWEFQGRAVKQGPVIYHATEEPEAIIDAEFAKMISSFGAPPPGFLNVCCGPVAARTFPEDLVGEIQQHTPVLTVVDTLFDAIAVEDEKSYAPVNQAMKRLRRVALDTNTHIMVAHHTAKQSSGTSGASILGSQAIRGSTEHNFTIVGVGGQTRKLNAEQRVGDTIDDGVILYDRETGEVSLCGTETEAEAKKRLAVRKLDAVVACIEQAHALGEVCNTRYIRNHVKGDNTVIKKATELAVKDGRISEEAGPNGSKLYAPGTRV